jgi:KaiC/GvpD/RAD55 family RecA-like ATPase
MPSTKVGLGLKGFERITPKRIPRQFWVSLVGPPGSFKTVFCIQAVESRLREGWKAIYVTTEMSPENIVGQARTIGYDWETPLREGSLTIMDTEVDENHYFPDEKDPTDYLIMSDTILAQRKRGTPSVQEDWILVIDSVASLWEDKPVMSRKFFRYIKRKLKIWFSLVFVTSQLSVTTNRAFGFGIEHLTDGILRTANYIEDGEMQSCLACVKMRATQVDRSLFKTRVTSAGPEILDKMEVRGRRANLYDALSGE